MVKPNFFIIGAPKCGTTALSEYLKDHPNVFICNPKEPSQFDVDLKRSNRLTLKQYLELFSDAKDEKYKAVGEATTSYLFSRVAVRNILEFNPESKFIVMIRNPVEMIRSLHSQSLFNGIENIEDFESAWRLENERKKGKNIPIACLDAQELFYSDWCKLGEQLNRLFSLVDKDRVKVIVFDEFISNTSKCYKDVLNFLNLDEDGRTSFPKVNPKKRTRFLLLQQFFVSIQNYYNYMRIFLGFKRGLGIMQKILLLNSKDSSYEKIDLKLKQELAKYFEKDIGDMAKLINRDLSSWLKP